MESWDHWSVLSHTPHYNPDLAVTPIPVPQLTVSGNCQSAITAHQAPGFYFARVGASPWRVHWRHDYVIRAPDFSTSARLAPCAVACLWRHIRVDARVFIHHVVHASVTRDQSAVTMDVSNARKFPVVFLISDLFLKSYHHGLVFLGRDGSAIRSSAS